MSLIAELAVPIFFPLLFYLLGSLTNSVHKVCEVPARALYEYHTFNYFYTALIGHYNNNEYRS